MFDEKSIRNPWKIWQLVKHHYFKQNHYIFYKCQLSQYTNFTMMKLGESIHLLYPKLNLIHGRNHHKKRRKTAQRHNHDFVGNTFFS